jgi:hypothetical protein
MGKTDGEVCLDTVRNETARITTCKHIFCQTCIEAVIANQAKCPLCRNDLPSVETTLVSPAKQTPQFDETDSLENMGESSSKLDALLHILDGTSAVSLSLPPFLPSLPVINISDTNKRSQRQNHRVFPIYQIFGYYSITSRKTRFRIR